MPTPPRGPYPEAPLRRGGRPRPTRAPSFARRAVPCAPPPTSHGAARGRERAAEAAAFAGLGCEARRGEARRGCAPMQARVLVQCPSRTRSPEGRRDRRQPLASPTAKTQTHWPSTRGRNVPST
eukprot:scaffold7215_cov366-Prasinococcus_capsulatus_cf.AAC.7